jgi:hypothetical protein
MRFFLSSYHNTDELDTGKVPLVEYIAFGLLVNCGFSPSYSCNSAKFHVLYTYRVFTDHLYVLTANPTRPA